MAALLGKHAKFGESYFSIHSDGSRESMIKINAGGYRNPSSVDTVKEHVVDEFGNIRTEEQGYMNGADVFNFLIREVPKDVHGMFEHFAVDQSSIDYFVFHKANNICFASACCCLYHEGAHNLDKYMPAIQNL